ncbi:hypothetical protein PFISCL1PPCAC_17757, partial [Pristionchus fissidentatus]
FLPPVVQIDVRVRFLLDALLAVSTVATQRLLILSRVVVEVAYDVVPSLLIQFTEFLLEVLNAERDVLHHKIGLVVAVVANHLIANVLIHSLLAVLSRKRRLRTGNLDVYEEFDSKPLSFVSHEIERSIAANHRSIHIMILANVFLVQSHYCALDRGVVVRGAGLSCPALENAVDYDIAMLTFEERWPLFGFN